MTSTPVISLWQPYATLIFRRRKKNETRPAGTPLPNRYVGVPVGIAATASFPPLKLMSEELHELCMDEFGCSYNYSLPLGCILGTVIFDRRVPTTEMLPADDDDRICGDWRPGRFAWPIMSVAPFVAPISAKGKQGWWFHDALPIAA